MVESGFCIGMSKCVREDGGLSPIDVFIYMVAMVCARATHTPIPNNYAQCFKHRRRF